MTSRYMVKMVRNTTPSHNNAETGITDHLLVLCIQEQLLFSLYSYGYLNLASAVEMNHNIIRDLSSVLKT